MDPETQRLKGNPSKRPPRIPSDTPPDHPLTELPDPPRWLGDVGEAEYERVGCELIAAGALTGGAVATLVSFASACQRQHDAEAELARLGTLTIPGSTGSTVAHPLVKIAKQAADAVRKFSAELRATPLSRVRNPVPPSPTKRKFEGLIAGLDFPVRK
jgi:P27 family predicted phage terminase small subunit